MSYEKSIDLKMFDMKKIKKNSVVVVIGKRGSGKSYLMKDLLYHHRKNFKIGKIFCKTNVLNQFYSDFIPNILISKHFDTKEIKKIFDRQEKVIREQWQDPYIFILADDCLSDAKHWVKDDQILELFYNGRHYKLLFILTLQTPMGITPNLRSNIDYTFIYNTNVISDKEKIYKHYAGVFNDKNEFYSVLNSLDEYECLVIDNITKSKNLEDIVFYYKAEEHPNFKMCSEQLWRKDAELNGKVNTNGNIYKYGKTNYTINKLNLKKK